MLRWSSEPVLRANQTVVGYATIMPNVKKGDVLSFVLTTDTHKITFSRNINVDFIANNLYTVVINLAESDKYVIEEGDSLRDISQRFGVKLSSIRKLNGFDEDYVPREGDIIRLRKK
jgi:LysM repeat protein